MLRSVAKRLMCTVFSLILCIPFIKAQKAVATQEQVWLGYINQMRFSKNWGLITDIHIRTKDRFFTNFSTSVFRTGLVYHMHDQLNVSAGYAYFYYFPADEHSGVARPEHRPWQQVQWTVRYPKLRLQQRLRLEERFRRRIKDVDELAPGYLFNYRVRFQSLLLIPLSTKPFTAKSFSAYVGDEFFLNFGKQVIYNTFDHNRIHAGLSYHVDEDDQLQFGYLNIFQQQGSGARYRMMHVARIYYQHALDFRKRK